MDDIPHKDPFLEADEPFSLPHEDRFRHVFVAGKTGVGKSTFLFNTALSDIEAGHGVGFIDPHGDEADSLIASIPPTRINDVCYVNLADTAFPVAFNPVAGVPIDERPRRIAAIVSSFAHTYRADGSWGHESERIIRNAVATLMDTPGMSLVALPRLINDDVFRARLVAHVHDPLVRAYWHHEFDTYQANLRDQKTSPPLNKAEELLANPVVRNVLAAGTNRVDARTIIDGKKILICNLAKGLLGETATNLIGSLIISLLGYAGLARADAPHDQREDFLLSIDEAHNFTTDAMAPFLSELRKYRLGLLMAQQYMDQASEKVRASILGNVGTFVVFRTSAADAELLSPEFGDIDPSYLMDQRVGSAWVRRERIFSVWSASKRASVRLPERRTIDTGQRSKVIARSRRVYAHPREHIERALYRYFQATPNPNST